MSLVTRCPRCRTLFRVAPAQLQARAGQVRCGRCMHVFDGFEALSSAAGAVGERRPDSPPAEAAIPAQPAAQSPAASAQAAAPRPAAVKVTPPAPVDSETTEAPEISFAARLRALPAAVRQASPHSRRIAACVVLAMLLASQMAYAFRSQLAARYPVVKSVLTHACGLAGCTVTLPQRPDLVKIEASDVHMIDANRPGLIQLTATLRSYANYDLAYPALDLVLTNANEHALARRIFVPEEYLDQTRDPQAGIAPRAEITVALDLDTADLSPAGFRLDLIAAPAAPRGD